MNKLWARERGILQLDEKEVIRQAQQNNEDAFEKLVIKYKPYIEKLSYQFGIQPENIPDIVQESFIKIYQNLNQFHRGKFSTWLYQITLNVVRDAYRKKQRELRIINKAITNKKEQIVSHFYFENDDYLLLHQAIQLLDENYRLPLILFYFHDQSYEEIAIILELKLSSVKTRMYRGRGKLKLLYENLEREEAMTNGRQTLG